MEFLLSVLPFFCPFCECPSHPSESVLCLNSRLFPECKKCHGLLGRKPKPLHGSPTFFKLVCQIIHGNPGLLRCACQCVQKVAVLVRLDSGLLHDAGNGLYGRHRICAGYIGKFDEVLGCGFQLFSCVSKPRVHLAQRGADSVKASRDVFRDVFVRFLQTFRGLAGRACGLNDIICARIKFFVCIDRCFAQIFKPGHSLFNRCGRQIRKNPLRDRKSFVGLFRILDHFLCAFIQVVKRALIVTDFSLRVFNSRLLI